MLILYFSFNDNYFCFTLFFLLGLKVGVEVKMFIGVVLENADSLSILRRFTHSFTVSIVS